MLKVQLKEGLEAGIDEAGRGCLAGPVMAAAVILPKNFNEPLLDDSKKLSLKVRNELRLLIEKEALAFAVGSCSPKEIDEVNILNASIEAMHRAVGLLRKEPIHLLVDGNRFKPYGTIPYTCVVKGDGKYQNIAAASVLAKTYRDEYMISLHEKFPFYDWHKNKGYPTVFHRKAIVEYGQTKYHRKSFHVKSF